MWLIYLYSLLSITILVYSVLAIIKGYRIVRHDAVSSRQNTIALIVLAALGALGCLGTLPGILGGEWTWLTHKVFWFVSNFA